MFEKCLKKNYFAIWILINTNCGTKYVCLKNMVYLKNTFPVGIRKILQVSDEALIGLLGIWTPVSGSLMLCHDAHEMREV